MPPAPPLPPPPAEASVGISAAAPMAATVATAKIVLRSLLWLIGCVLTSCLPVVRATRRVQLSPQKATSCDGHHIVKVKPAIMVVSGKWANGRVPSVEGRSVITMYGRHEERAAYCQTTLMPGAGTQRRSAIDLTLRSRARGLQRCVGGGHGNRNRSYVHLITRLPA
jgi:hypothetical protein